MNYNTMYNDEKNKSLLRTLNDIVFDFRKMYGDTHLTRRMTNILADEYFSKSSCNRDQVCNTTPERDNSILSNFMVKRPIGPIGNNMNLGFWSSVIQDVINEINTYNNTSVPLYIPVNRTNNVNTDALKKKLEECMES